MLKPTHAAKDFHAKLTFALTQAKDNTLQSTEPIQSTWPTAQSTLEISTLQTQQSSRLQNDYITDSTLIISRHQDSRSRPRHQHDDECKQAYIEGVITKTQSDYAAPPICLGRTSHSRRYRPFGLAAALVSLLGNTLVLL